MYKLLRMAVFALPLAGGAAWAQASGTSGSAGAPGSAMTPPVTDDTRTPLQQRAGRLDDTAPAMPGDATKPVDVPNRIEERAPDTSTDMNTPGSGATDKKVHKRKTVDESRIERKSDTTLDTDRNNNKSDKSTNIEDKSSSDINRDQLDSDK